MARLRRSEAHNILQRCRVPIGAAKPCPTCNGAGCDKCCNGFVA